MQRCCSSLCIQTIQAGLPCHCFCWGCVMKPESEPECQVLVLCFLPQLQRSFLHQPLPWGEDSHSRDQGVFAFIKRLCSKSTLTLAPGQRTKSASFQPNYVAPLFDHGEAKIKSFFTAPGTRGVGASEGASGLQVA